MSVLISDENYAEYMTLQHNAIHQQKLDSAKGMINLKNDIDVPMRKLVAMFALLDCSPLWSCCGFDYDGQPMHKTHEYGDTYIMFHDTPRTKAILKILSAGKWVDGFREDTSKWISWQNKNIIYLRSDFDYEHGKIGYPWSLNHCIHYPELSVLRIKELQDLLFLYFADEFMDIAVLRDTNRSQKWHVSNWQYPALEDWIITKEEMLEL